MSKLHFSKEVAIGDVYTPSPPLYNTPTHGAEFVAKNEESESVLSQKGSTCGAFNPKAMETLLKASLVHLVKISGKREKEMRNERGRKGSTRSVETGSITYISTEGQGSAQTHVGQKGAPGTPRSRAVPWMFRCCLDSLLFFRPQLWFGWRIRAPVFVA